MDRKKPEYLYIDTETKNASRSNGYLVFRRKCNGMPLNLFFSFSLYSGFFLLLLLILLLKESIAVCVCRYKRVYVKKKEQERKRKKNESLNLIQTVQLNLRYP